MCHSVKFPENVQISEMDLDCPECSLFPSDWTSFPDKKSSRFGSLFHCGHKCVGCVPYSIFFLECTFWQRCDAQLFDILSFRGSLQLKCCWRRRRVISKDYVALVCSGLTLYIRSCKKTSFQIFLIRMALVLTQSLNLEGLFIYLFIYLFLYYFLNLFGYQGKSDGQTGVNSLFDDYF